MRLLLMEMLSLLPSDSVRLASCCHLWLTEVALTSLMESYR